MARVQGRNKDIFGKYNSRCSGQTFWVTDADLGFLDQVVLITL